MKRTTTLVIALWAVFVTQNAFAQKGNEEQLIKDANTYFISGEYLKAFPLFSQLVSLYPNHPDYNYKFGACAIFSEQDKTKAVRFLTIATNKGVEDKMAWYYLGKAYHLNYQFKEAIKAYENFIRNADPKITAKTDAQREIETCIYGSNLLSNIKDISVISKTETDKANFFRYFNLEAIGGKILTIPDELKSKLDVKSTDPGVIHYPGNSTTIYFSSYGKDGVTGKDIYKAQILPDGKFSAATKLEGDINTKYDEDYCFMHSDGKTLYFASKGHNSMGGYDIFKSVFDEKEQKFGPAINLDFAINTPDDDIFYIADSLNQKAYFASGRASDLAHMNVYNVLVESTPLQIVYIKGSYISEINPDQSKAGIKVVDENSGRIVCDGISGGATGSYILYVPKPGEYTYKVVTENSPMIHEVKVNVPLFKQPVAVRQEMKLVSDNGKDKLIVTNYFETPLDEDISALAAEMLRKKSNLDVNTNSDVLASVPASNSKTSGGELTTFEKTINNAPISAGFANGLTIADVTKGMQTETNKINTFVNESDLKYDNSLAFAYKKHKEADAALTEAETIRKSLGNISTDEDIRQLRKSVELVDRAESLQQEAKAAMNAAESIKQYKVSEKDRATSLTEQITAIKAAESAGDYDKAVSLLTVEKDRQTAMRNGESNTPIDELKSKVKARESERAREELKLNDLRANEKDLAEQTKVAEEKLAAAKKDKDKQVASTELATVKSKLDGVRKNIVAQVAKVEKIGEDAQMANANAQFFSQIAENSSYGVDAKDKTKLTDAEKSMLSMRLDEMGTRMSNLEIKDPQMLAIITNGADEGAVAENTSTTPPANVLVGSTEKSTTTGNSDKSSNTSATTGKPANVSSGTLANSTPEKPTTVGPTVVASIKTRRDAQLAKTNSDPSLAPARRMILANSLAETDQTIYILESKKKAGTFTEADNTQLAELNSLRKEIKTAISNNPASAESLSPTQIRDVYASVSPDYTTKTQSITNAEGTEIDRAVKMMGYKKLTLDKLIQARTTNANLASSETESLKLQELAKKDQQYEMAINTLRNETGDVNQIKAAYETENKSIIESDAVFAAKLQDQITISENYVEALGIMESETQAEMDKTPDPDHKILLNTQLTAIQEEEKLAFTKLETYRHDLQLTASAADPTVAPTSTTNASSNTNLTLEDMMEETTMTAPKVNEPVAESTESAVKQDAVKIEKMFKRQEEAESIFAYESGSFEEIATQHQKDGLELKNREKIREFNDQIFLIEAEMENEESPAKLRKLDYKAEQCYLRRSLIEIDNAATIEKMTRMEYDEELATAEKAAETNKEKIESKIMIREEVKRLKREAEVHMRNAEEIRKKAPAIQDDIEKADYYRQAFAKEALAIDNLHKIQNICDNIDMLVKYSEQDLAQLRTGKVPNDELAASLTKNSGPKKSEIPVSNETTPTETVVDKKILIAEISASEKSNSTSENTTGDLATKPEKVEMTKPVGQENSTNQVLNFSTTTSGDIVTDKKTVTADPNGTVSVNMTVAEPTTKTIPAAVTTTEETLIADKSNVATSTVNAATTSTPKSTESTPKTTGTAVASVESRSTTAPANVAPASSNASASANAEDYYWAMPEVVTTDLFKRTNRAVYSESKPIPIDAEMPKGVYYKVQVGAFRKDIPQNLYDEFAPISGESLSNGITRYTAGFFVQYNNADQVKKEIRSLGYSDAFVVAFRDGKRIPLYEAMGKTESQEFVANIEKEYVYGDKGEAPKANSSVADKSTDAFSNKPLVTDYYKGTPNAVKADQVEAIAGLFFTVQVGVYSKPVPAKNVYNITELNSELTESKKIRYTSGRYSSMMDAVQRRSEAKDLGIRDAFITAYYNGKRITLTEADRLLQEKGPSILAK